MCMFQCVRINDDDDDVSETEIEAVVREKNLKISKKAVKSVQWAKRAVFDEKRICGRTMV